MIQIEIMQPAGHAQQHFAHNRHMGKIIGIHRRLAANALLHPQPDADLAPGELFGAGKIKGEGSPVYPVAAAELPVQLLQGLLVKILLLQGLGRQAVYLLEGPVPEY